MEPLARAVRKSSGLIAGLFAAHTGKRVALSAECCAAKSGEQFLNPLRPIVENEIERSCAT